MNQNQVLFLQNKLIKKGVDFDSGLTKSEINNVQKLFGFEFTPDLKLFLETTLPTNREFPNWRKAISFKEEQDKIFSMLNLPLDGILFDIEHNNFWFDSWGIKPASLESKIEIATRTFATYPVLIPIYSHRYIPSSPKELGNPVFSVHQTDIIYYGFDLATYFANEFKLSLSSDFVSLKAPIRQIEFWSSFVS